MAPDRGSDRGSPSVEAIPSDPPPQYSQAAATQSHDEAEDSLAARAAQLQNFTLRGILVGLVIGVVIVSSNTYFGLQTGWVSGMTMPSALIAFAFFKAIGRYLNVPFSPVENVLIQTVAGSAGTMPLGCGFVGVVPALEYFLKPEEGGPLNISLGRLALWAVGICLFGVVFAVPLRKETIIREKLRFPSGTATALLIGVLHGGKQEASVVKQGGTDSSRSRHSGEEDEQDALISPDEREESERIAPVESTGMSRAEMMIPDTPNPAAGGGNWKSKIRLLTWAFAASGLYTVFIYFVPKTRKLPIFGFIAKDWLWTLNPSPAYVGQGIIMGPATTAHMLLGSIIGWGILSPIAKQRGWAPGPVRDWSTGSKGWIVWVSLAIMLADALVSLGWLVLRPAIYYTRTHGPALFSNARKGAWSEISEHFSLSSSHRGYSPLATNTGPSTQLLETPNNPNRKMPSASDEPEVDAPPKYQVSNRSFALWAVVRFIPVSISLALYFISIPMAFPRTLSLPLIFLALVLALLLSIMGVRALGETDLNPVSGISKLTQLLFAFLIPSTAPSAVIINLLAGAISESAALQAGDLMQDLKTGHLLGAAPNAQFYGQLVGSVVGAVVSAAVYKAYTNVYRMGEGQFEVPTAFVWVFTARLVTGRGLPEMASTFAFGAAAIYAALTALRIAGKGSFWADNLVPGGIAVAVGMYNTPSFVLARAAGGLISWYWVKWRRRDETTVVVLASGLILGEGLLSILNLGMTSLGVPHLKGWDDDEQ